MKAASLSTADRCADRSGADADVGEPARGRHALEHPLDDQGGRAEPQYDQSHLAVAAGAEDDELIRVPDVRLPRSYSRPSRAGSTSIAFGAGWPARGDVVTGAVVVRSIAFAPYRAGQGLASQISAAYCAMVRSLENVPEAATLRTAFCAHPFGSA
jgi:hypothetical protein